MFFQTINQQNYMQILILIEISGNPVLKSLRFQPEQQKKIS